MVLVNKGTKTISSLIKKGLRLPVVVDMLKSLGVREAVPRTYRGSRCTAKVVLLEEHDYSVEGPPEQSSLAELSVVQSFRRISNMPLSTFIVTSQTRVSKQWTSSFTQSTTTIR